MTPQQKLIKLRSLCEEYRKHLEATQKKYPDEAIYNKKHEAIRALEALLPNSLEDGREESGDSISSQILCDFSQAFYRSKADISAHRSIDSVGMVFIKAVATVLSLGAVLLINNFWKSRGSQSCAKIERTLYEDATLCGEGEETSYNGLWLWSVPMSSPGVLALLS